MGRAVALREDFEGPGLRCLAKASKDAGAKPAASCAWVLINACWYYCWPSRSISTIFFSISVTRPSKPARLRMPA